MKILKIDAWNPEKKKINQVINVLENDGVIVYPTDTVYGLGVNIYSETAIRKVYSIKKRERDKPISICLSEFDDLEKIAETGIWSKEIRKNLPGPFTIILNSKECISPLLTGGSKKIGIRIPKNNICRELTRKFPITSTSANLSGESVPCSADEVARKLGDQVDLIIDGGETTKKPSTVVDCTQTPPKILRKGINEFIL